MAVHLIGEKFTLKSLPLPVVYPGRWENGWQVPPERVDEIVGKLADAIKDGIVRGHSVHQLADSVSAVFLVAEEFPVPDVVVGGE